ncbi:endonuclease domain-containing protein [Micromonosporaceae bacterium Da 78-11]
MGRPRLDGKPTAQAFKLVVDHSHDSPRVRGLLCFGCNYAIGHFRDDELTLRAALLYLARDLLPKHRKIT